jgi:hypothetical protein
MIDKEQGKSIMIEVVERYSSVERNPKLIKERVLSEQDITTKFVLPMLRALNWDAYKITTEGPEVHEKAFREKSDVGKGLPDVTLKNENGTVYVEVKRPGEIRKGIANLERYGDADLIVLTTFKDLRIYTCRREEEPRKRFDYTFDQYVTEFDQLWKILSNSKQGKDTRTAIKATR